MDERKTRLFLASFPPINDLICIIGQVSSTEIDDPLVESLYHKRILKCRLLIYLLPEIIASPLAMRNDEGIYILIKPKLFSTGKIQSELNDLNIKYSRFVGKVSQQIYEACLKYTISFKLAPRWNKVDQYFIEGQYFLDSLSYSTNAIKMKIIITGNETSFSLSPANITVPELSLEYFSLSPRTIQDFITDNNGIILLNSSEAQSWVYILPSLNKAKVISISKKIPEASLFKDYKQLKEHWRNMYGYQLPETDSELIYYQVYFPGFGENSYTYPNCCVKSAKLKTLELDNSINTVKPFVKDLIEKVPQICGKSLTLEEIHQSPIYQSRHEVKVHKENIPNKRSQAPQDTEFIWNQKRVLQNTETRPNCGFKMSGDYIHLFDGNSNKQDDYRRAFTPLFNNPANLKQQHNVIKDKSLKETLNMKSFLQVQYANRKTLTPCINNEFYPVTGKTLVVGSSNVLELASNSYEKEKSLRETAAKVETIFTTQNQSVNIDADKLLPINNQTREKDLLFDHSLLRSRSSFELSDFDTTLSEKNSYDQILNGNQLLDGEKNDFGNEVAVKSHYFKDVEKESQNSDKVLKSNISSSSSKLKFHSLSKNKKLTTQTELQLKPKRKENFKTKDISSYFKETKQVQLCDQLKGVTNNHPTKLIQMQLNVKRSGKVELCAENKKQKINDEND